MSYNEVLEIKDLLKLEEKEYLVQYEYHNYSENSHKFYELRIVKSPAGRTWNLIAKWGRVGTIGQTSKKYSCGSSAGCMRELMKIESEKAKKGYKKIFESTSRHNFYSSESS